MVTTTQQRARARQAHRDAEARYRARLRETTVSVLLHLTTDIRQQLLEWRSDELTTMSAVVTAMVQHYRDRKV